MDTLCLVADASGPVVESPNLVSRTHGVNKAAADGNYHHHLPKSEKEIYIFDCLPPVKSVPLRSFILFKPNFGICGIFP